jgi:hypothetical protein
MPCFTHGDATPTKGSFGAGHKATIHPIRAISLTKACLKNTTASLCAINLYFEVAALPRRQSTIGPVTGIFTIHINAGCFLESDLQRTNSDYFNRTPTTH